MSEIFFNPAQLEEVVGLGDEPPEREETKNIAACGEQGGTENEQICHMKTRVGYRNYFILGVIVATIILAAIIWWKVCQHSAVENFHEKSTADITSFVDVIYWINLDHRKDRYEEFMLQMDKLEYPRDRIIRISAVHEKGRGHLGCSKSHIQCLETFMKSNHHRNCLVFEDDFDFIASPADIQRGFEQLVGGGVEYDVCMLSGNVVQDRETHLPFLRKVLAASTTSGYLVTRAFAPVLLDNFRESCRRLEQSYLTGTPDTPYDHYSALDQYWIKLQPGSRWYIFQPKMGIQRESFSEIQSGVVNYNL